MSDLTTIEQHNAHRAETWAKVWALTASANDCKSEAIATSWADKCVQTYDLIFTSVEFIKDHRDCWVNTWAATASANDCKSPSAASRFANACLAEYKKRF